MFFDAFRRRAGILPVIPLRDITEIVDDNLLQDFFSAVDTDNSGTISKKEMLRAMRKTKMFEAIAEKHNKLRPLLRGKTYLTTFQKINASGTSEITFEELQVRSRSLATHYSNTVSSPVLAAAHTNARAEACTI